MNNFKLFMNRRFQNAILTIASLLCCSNVAMAQLVTAPDTVCVFQDVTVTSTINNGRSYFWGTCSGYLERNPIGGVIAANAPLSNASVVKLLKDADSNYYLFTVNTAAPFNLIKYSFGKSLTTLPTPTDLGNAGGKVPAACTGLDFMNVGGNWFAISVGGVGPNYKLTRYEFGSSLANVPNVVDLGNPASLISFPQDLHLFTEGGNYYGHYFNLASGNLVRLNFGTSITNVPSVLDLGNMSPGNFANPTGFDVVKQGANFYEFVINRTNNNIIRLDYGTSLLNVPAAVLIGTLGASFTQPRDLKIYSENNNYYGYVSNEGNNTLVGMKFGNSITNIPVPTNFGNLGPLAQPRGISEMFRDYDNVYSFVINYFNNTITKIHYDTTTFATTLKSTDVQPPVYQYTVPGLYNVYYYYIDSATGQKIEEQNQIQVLPKPPLFLQNDTVICQGDTMFMVANAGGLSEVLWSPTYNLLYQNDTTSVYVFPDESYTYNVRMSFYNGCILDTMVNVYVSKIHADAGPDKLVADGAPTQIGGVQMSQGSGITYSWTPSDYLNDSTLPYPTSRVLDSLQYYYLTVRNANGCERKDTMAVRSFCGEINIPNAFNPKSPSALNRTFGIENYQLKSLTHFRVFNRYGQLLFETTDPRKRWDGNYKLMPQPSDTYVWSAEGICENGRRVKRSGNVLLVR
jgi:gliding motility-associated-like protein